MDIGDNNYFRIFSLDESFRIDLTYLNQQFQKLQAEYHPDRFSAAGDAERLRALQASSILNQAYDVLKSPLKRAGHLLSLHGIDPEASNQADLGEEFLMLQMEWRDELERLSNAEDLDALERMQARISGELQDYLDRFETSYDTGDYPAAKKVYSRLQFIFKLRDEILQAEEKLLDY